MNDEQQIIEPVPTMAGYKKIPTFKLWIANQFPYIETDFDAITNYELLQAVIKYLNTIIENENNVESNVTALYNAFVNLHDYVEEQFDSLNLQDEVNTKIDEMYESGLFDNLLNNYLNLTKVFDTYNDMIFDTSTFVNGMKIKTLGYQYINDGGGAEYFVTNVQNDNKYQVNIGTNLWLEMIIKDILYSRQLGLIDNNNFNQDEKIALFLNMNKYAEKLIFNNELINVYDPISINTSNNNLKIDFSNCKFILINSQSYLNGFIGLNYTNKLDNSSKISITGGSFDLSVNAPIWNSDGNGLKAGNGAIKLSYFRNVNIKNIEFNDIFYSSAIHIMYADTISIIGCKGTNVGGIAPISRIDSAGDAIYLAKLGVYNDTPQLVGGDDLLNQNVNVLIENCNFKGYEAIETNDYSLMNCNHSGRCGIVVGEYSLNNKVKNIKINNCYFYNYQRTFHVEYTNKWNIDISNCNVEEYGDILLISNGNTYDSIKVTNSTFNKTKKIRGYYTLYTNYGHLLYQSVDTTYALENPVIFENCYINGYGYLIRGRNTGKTLFNNCCFNMQEIGFINSNLDFINCKIVALSSYMQNSLYNILNSYIELSENAEMSRKYYFGNEGGNLVNQFSSIINSTLKNCAIGNSSNILIDRCHFILDDNFAPSKINYNYQFITTDGIILFKNNTVTSSKNVVFTGFSLPSTKKIEISNNRLENITFNSNSINDDCILIDNNTFITDLVLSYFIQMNNNFATVINNRFYGLSADEIKGNTTKLSYNNYRISNNTATLI